MTPDTLRAHADALGQRRVAVALRLAERTLRKWLAPGAVLDAAALADLAPLLGFESRDNGTLAAVWDAPPKQRGGRPKGSTRRVTADSPAGGA